MKKFQLNLKDNSGNIRTGYQEIVEVESKEEAINDYLHYIIANEDESVTEENIDCVEL